MWPAGAADVSFFFIFDQDKQFRHGKVSINWWSTLVPRSRSRSRIWWLCSKCDVGEPPWRRRRRWSNKKSKKWACQVRMTPSPPFTRPHKSRVFFFSMMSCSHPTPRSCAWRKKGALWALDFQEQSHLEKRELTRSGLEVWYFLSHSHTYAKSHQGSSMRETYLTGQKRARSRRSVAHAKKKSRAMKKNTYMSTRSTTTTKRQLLKAGQIRWSGMDVRELPVLFILFFAIASWKERPFASCLLVSVPCPQSPQSLTLISSLIPSCNTKINIRLHMLDPLLITPSPSTWHEHVRCLLKPRERGTLDLAWIKKTTNKRIHTCAGACLGRMGEGLLTPLQFTFPSPVPLFYSFDLWSLLSHCFVVCSYSCMYRAVFLLYSPCSSRACILVCTSTRTDRDYELCEGRAKESRGKVKEGIDTSQSSPAQARSTNFVFSSWKKEE